MQIVSFSFFNVGPARAGMIRMSVETYFTVEGWPRTSGDDPTLHAQWVSPAQLAPHERG